MPGTGGGAGCGCGGRESGQAGWGSGLELGFFLGAQPMKPAGLHSDAFRVNSEAVSPSAAQCTSAPAGFGCGRCLGGVLSGSSSGRREGKLFFSTW